MTKRILQIIPSLDRAGAEKQFTLLATHLDPGEFDVHTCALTRGGPYEADLARHETPFTSIGKSWKVDPRAYFRLKKLIRRLQPDLVQTWLFAANAYGRAAALGCGVKTVVGSEQCADPWKRWHELSIDRYLARRSARIVVNGRGVRDFYVGQGIDSQRFELIENGIAAHQPGGRTRDELLRELKLPADAKLIAAIGRLWLQKRVRDVIWAVELLQNVRDDVHLLIVGDGPERRRLEKFRDNVQLQRRVHFLGHRNDVPEFLEHIDVLWSASMYEGLPNTIMEAMAAGVPVVATDIAGNNDLVADGQTGYLVKVGDTAGLARCAIKILADKRLSLRLAEAARNEMLTKYPIKNMVDRHAELYRQLLD
ncbi:MAG: glycosyltransferase [Planctomycetota bacterium]|nr:glycosyltransferase [Planctomycetota bacterium]